MRLNTLLKNALDSLTVNKLRTFLTVLGIVIGITSVITLVNIGEAAQGTIESSVSAFGSDLITIIPGKFSSGSQGFSFDLSASFDFQNVVDLKSKPNLYLKGISTESSKLTNVRVGLNNQQMSITGVYGDYFLVRSVELLAGREINLKDSDTLSRVAVIGPDIRDKFFDENPIGKTINISNQNYTIVGITKPRGSNGFQNLDEVVIIPLKTMQKLITGTTTVRSIIVSASDPKYISLAAEEVKNNLRDIRGIDKSEDSDFTVRTSAQALGILTDITNIFTIFLALISGISLLVGGIGIMNIMFVSVKERTREIGLRKALGATRNDILYQFLTESIAVTMLGGILGTILGILLTYIFTQVAALAFSININTVILAVGVSGLIGLIFGSYPAWQAAKLDPIVALRYE